MTKHKRKTSKLHSTVPNRVVLLVAVLGVGIIGSAYIIFSQAAITAHYSGNAERDHLARVNTVRKNAGKRLVKHIDCLNNLAEKWSQNMANQNKLYHNSNLAGSATNGWSMAHYCGGGRSSGYGETVAYATGTDANASLSAFRSFMNSAPHKAIILDNKYNRVGIGIYVSSRGVMWVTHIYAACNSDCTAAKWSQAVTYPNSSW